MTAATTARPFFDNRARPVAGAVWVPFSDIDLQDRTHQYRIGERPETLLASLAQAGQKEPVKLQRRKGKPHRIEDGWTRIAGLQILGAEGVWALVYDDSDEEAAARAWEANALREDWRTVDQLHAIWRMHHDLRLSDEKIAARTGKSVTRVVTLRKAADDLTPRNWDDLRTDRISVAHVQEVRRIPKERWGRELKYAADKGLSSRAFKERLGTGKRKSYFRSRGKTRYSLVAHVDEERLELREAMRIQEAADQLQDRLRAFVKRKIEEERSRPKA